MIGYSILSPVFADLLHGMVGKIYHDVIIVEQDKNRFPAYPVGDEYIYVGVDDTKIMNCYLRQVGEMRNISTSFIGGCSELYNIRVPYRLVFFNDPEKRKFDDLNNAIINSLFHQHVEFTSLITDRRVIQQQENLVKNFTLGARTFYVAVDFAIKFQMTKNNCGDVIGCVDIPNPICLAQPIITDTGIPYIVDYDYAPVVDDNPDTRILYETYP